MIEPEKVEPTVSDTVAKRFEAAANTVLQLVESGFFEWCNEVYAAAKQLDHDITVVADNVELLRTMFGAGVRPFTAGAVVVDLGNARNENQKNANN
jgi:hypothetical protein